MVVITGGVTILPNSDNKAFLNKLKDAKVKVTVPFEATNFKCSNPISIDGMAVEDYVPEKAEVISEPISRVPKKKKNPKKKSIRTLLRR